MDLSRLAEPFPESRVQWRAMQANKGANGYWVKALAYIDARDIQNRLDEVCGPLGWKNTLEPICDSTGLRAFTGGISIKDAEGEWVTKVDGAETTDFEPIKGGISGAFKRAAALWGIGRYLYDLDEGWGQDVTTQSPKGDPDYIFTKAKDGQNVWFKPPALPKWATPNGALKRQPTLRPEASSSQMMTDEECIEVCARIKEDENVDVIRWRNKVAQRLKEKTMTDYQAGLLSDALADREKQGQQTPF